MCIAYMFYVKLWVMQALGYVFWCCSDVARGK